MNNKKILDFLFIFCIIQIKSKYIYSRRCSVIAYPKAFKKTAREKPQEVQQPKDIEDVQVWLKLTNEVWDLSMSNYYFDTWMWQFKKMPGVLTRITKLIEQMNSNKTADVAENELRKNLDYLKNAHEMIEYAQEKVENALRLIWARRKELK
jgi:hypothetical protein